MNRNWNTLTNTSARIRIFQKRASCFGKSADSGITFSIRKLIISIYFSDIFGALTDGKACQYLKDLLLDHVRQNHPDIDLIVGLESRGFLFNLMLASELGVGCAPIRKKGKLPGECISVEYTLEYGTVSDIT